MYAQIYKRALTRQRILHLEEVGQLLPSLEDLVFVHGGLLLNLREHVPSSEDVLVIHISEVLLQSVSLYIRMYVQQFTLCTVQYNMYTDALGSVHTVHVFMHTCAYLCTYVHQGWNQVSSSGSPGSSGSNFSGSDLVYKVHRPNPD